MVHTSAAQHWQRIILPSVIMQENSVSHYQMRQLFDVFTSGILIREGKAPWNVPRCEATHRKMQKKSKKLHEWNRTCDNYCRKLFKGTTSNVTWHICRYHDQQYAIKLSRSSVQEAAFHISEVKYTGYKSNLVEMQYCFLGKRISDTYGCLALKYAARYSQVIAYRS
jgi:hypothetical protein